MIKDQAKAEYVVYKDGTYKKIRNEQDLVNLRKDIQHRIVSRNTKLYDIIKFMGKEDFHHFLMLEIINEKPLN